MPPEERTRKASRRKVIIESTADSEYDQLQQERSELATSERQMERGGGLFTDRPLLDGGHILAPWNVPVSVLTSNRRMRMRFWLVVVVTSAIITLTSIGVLFLT